MNEKEKETSTASPGTEKANPTLLPKIKSGRTVTAPLPMVPAVAAVILPYTELRICLSHIQGYEPGGDYGVNLYCASKQTFYWTPEDRVDVAERAKRQAAMLSQLDLLFGAVQLNSTGSNTKS